ncbi:MAG TPA: hypothetical protein PLH70_05005 [Bacteroidales bacterium]|nr:hypothetical protein [Bacteroidales bacterium]HOH22275.1 hypothetical protein [Bacteroidales bacterium]HPB57728.1 hypothetical protein [Bacteroidales bacterium]HPZ03678.1 hypothetical protein [Bacteroidales bacterium]HQB75142.1 hypothetical protein [Bacteroidales bacterium]
MHKFVLVLSFILFYSPCQGSDTLKFIPNIKATTHIKFFVHDCKCGMFNPKFFHLEVNTTANEPHNRTYWICPPDFEQGHAVIITGKQGDFFRIKFTDEVNPVCGEFCEDSSFFVKKGTLGTWVYNYDYDTRIYNVVPLYKKPHADSKIVAKLTDEGAVVILDCEGSWIYVETITKGRKKRGWLNSTTVDMPLR